MNGNALLFNIRNDAKTSIKLRPKQSRSCNTVSFSSNGFLAVGLDKVRNENCLQIWNIDRVSQGDGHNTPTYSFLPSDVISSLAFLPDTPPSLLCGSYKFIREFDLRTQSSVTQFATKCVRGICVDPFNQHYFSSHSEDGTVAFWDRRQVRNGEPLLLLNSAGDARNKTAFTCFRLSNIRRGEFALLQDGDTIKRWQNGFVPLHREPAEAATRTDQFTQFDYSRQPYSYKPDNLFVASVTQTTNKLDRFVSFDYVYDISSPLTVNFICVKQSGQIFRMRVTESPTAVKFDPFNSVATVDPENISFLTPRADRIIEPHESTRRASAFTEPSTDTFDDDMELMSDTDDVYYNPSTLLAQDISTTIRKLAIQGYGMECERNINLLESSHSHPKIESMRYTWRWLELARRSAFKGSMIAGELDLSYEGVLGIWEGYSWYTTQRRKNTTLTKHEYSMLVDKILEGSNRSIFTQYISRDKTKRALRQLCLRVAGWNFQFSQLEEKLRELETEGKYEQAAGWAVFHGDVERAVKSLAASKNERLRIMSTAVAGYMAYKDSTGPSPWKDLCQKMASELDNPYMRAVFAFISESDWMEVLNEGSLPLHERLGVALRFLPDKELSQYFDQLSKRVVSDGDLDGIILTGVTPRAVDLLQSYVDKTCDVQTASLIISHGAPRYFEDERTTHWVECYRSLLNSWRLFSQRSFFDVARSKFSKNSHGQITSKIVPRQVFLRCNHCKKVIGSGQTARPYNASRKSSQIKVQGTESSIRCSFCNHPLPRCAICLLPLGSSFPQSRQSNLHDEILDTSRVFSNESAPSVTGSQLTNWDDSTSNVGKWFTFCLSCNHGVHANHSQEWFNKHSVCPVPDCNCNCTQFF